MKSMNRGTVMMDMLMCMRGCMRMICSAKTYGSSCTAS